MAAYAAVVSLMNTMDAVMNDPHLSTCFDEQQIRSLGENLDILLQFIENCDYNSLGHDEEAQSMERRFTSAAHTAKDVIETHIVAQIHAGVLEDASASSIDLHQMIHDIDEIKEEVVKIAEKTGNSNQTPKNSTQRRQTAGEITMIGFDDYLIQLLDGLTGSESSRQVIPVVGMGGVGKTTLTKNAYENSLTAHHFDVRAWVSISQQYDVKDILVQILSSLGQSADEKNELCELSERLYKYLYGRRYLIVLDDMWSIRAWDKIKFCFPEGSDCSRIIVTTRLLEVANDFGSSSVVRVGLLDDDKSWDLFCDKAFAQKSCPGELEELGKTIVNNCKGLPLSIVVIGSLLGKSSHSREHWENLAKNMSSILSLSDDSLDILCLSYNHLPAHLKPCFLYLGTFKEDDEVSVSELIKLWIAEGFIKPNKEQMLEEVAEGYVYDLLERSLILVDIYSLGWNKKFSRFRIHDLVRDLCLREAHKEKLFFVISRHTIVEEAEVQLHCPFTLKFFDIFKNVNMRFHCCEIYGKGDASAHTVFTELPRSIFLLWNLQTLIVRNYRIIIKAPVEIWKMRQLRHIEFNRISLPEPPLREEEGEFVVLHNLQTLEKVVDLRCSEEVCKRIPNIKRLEVYYKSFSKKSNEYYCLQNVGRLNKLESISFGFSDSWGSQSNLLLYLTFPTSLKELSLFNSNLEWNDLGIFGSLPNLEVLKISRFIRYVSYSTDGEWKCVEGQFLALKHLVLEYLTLERWIVESCHFPVLDTLTLNCVELCRGLPLDIGKIPTLRVIGVRNYDSTGLPISAMRLLKEQEDLGNDLLQLQLQLYSKKELDSFLEQVEKEGIECTNFTCVIFDY